MTEPKEDFVKRALELVETCLKDVKNDLEAENYLMDATYHLFDGLDDIHIIPGNILEKSNIVERDTIYEELEHEKCEKWQSWMDAVKFFTDTKCPDRVRGETELLYDWIDRTRYQYLKLIQYHIDNPTVMDWD